MSCSPLLRLKNIMYPFGFFHSTVVLWGLLMGQLKSRVWPFITVTRCHSASETAIKWKGTLMPGNSHWEYRIISTAHIDIIYSISYNSGETSAGIKNWWEKNNRNGSELNWWKWVSLPRSQRWPKSKPRSHSFTHLYLSEPQCVGVWLYVVGGGGGSVLHCTASAKEAHSPSPVPHRMRVTGSNMVILRRGL